VAIELAASCQPFENSKANVRKTTMRSREKLDIEEVANCASRKGLGLNGWPFA